MKSSQQSTCGGNISHQQIVGIKTYNKEWFSQFTVIFSWIEFLTFFDLLNYHTFSFSRVRMMQLLELRYIFVFFSRLCDDFHIYREWSISFVRCRVRSSSSATAWCVEITNWNIKLSIVPWILMEFNSNSFLIALTENSIIIPPSRRLSPLSTVVLSKRPIRSDRQAENRKNIWWWWEKLSYWILNSTPTSYIAAFWYLSNRKKKQLDTERVWVRFCPWVQEAYQVRRSSNATKFSARRQPHRTPQKTAKHDIGEQIEEAKKGLVQVNCIFHVVSCFCVLCVFTLWLACFTLHQALCALHCWRRASSRASGRAIKSHNLQSAAARLSFGLR